MAKGKKEEKPASDVERAFKVEYGGYSRGNKTSGIGCKITIPSAKEPTKRKETLALLDRLFVGAQGEATLSFDPVAGNDVDGQTKMVATEESCVGIADVHGMSIKATTVGLKLSFNRDDEPEMLREFSCQPGTLRFKRTGETNGEGEE